MTRARRKKNNNPNNRIISLVIVIVVIVLCIVLAVRSNQIKKQNASSQIRIEKIKQQIEEQKKIQSELLEYEKYTKTKQFVEEIARTRFGLIYPDEVIFKNTNESKK